MKSKLLIIINRFVIGGQAADTIPLLYRLKDKYAIKIIYGEKEADEIEPLFLLQQFPGLDMQKLPSLKRSINPFADVISTYRIYKIIKAYKPNIVHTHGAKSGVAGRLAAKLYGRCKIVHTFHGHLFHSYFNKFTTSAIIKVERGLSYITDAAIALSASQQNELVNTFNIFPASKMHEIPLGLFEPEEKQFYGNEFRNKYQLNHRDVAIGIVGRLVPIKNHVDFLKIAQIILQKGYPNVKFFVIGDGNQRASMIDFLKQANISFALPGDADQDVPIIFTSWISNMYEVLHQLDVVVLTSHNEGTPVSLIEAQLCAKPVVAYNVGGVKDTFSNNDTGFLVNKGDISTFAHKLSKLIEDKALRISMGERAKAYSSHKFSKDAEVVLIDQLYQHLLKQ